MVEREEEEGASDTEHISGDRYGCVYPHSKIGRDPDAVADFHPNDNTSGVYFRGSKQK